MTGELFAVSADQTRIHYEVRGQGETVVLLHGLACDRHMWDDVAGLLEQAGQRVVIPDLRGHGESRAVDGFGLERFAEDTRALLEATSAKNCTLVGHSAGGIQAIAFAASLDANDDYQPACVITFGTSPTLDRRPERMVLQFSTSRLFYALLALPIVGHLVVRAGAFGKRPPSREIRATVRSARACPRPVKRGWVNAMTGRSFLAEMQSIPADKRMGAGARDSAFSLKRLRACVGDSVTELFEVPDAGHMVPLENPAAVASIILRRGSKQATAP